MRSKLLEYYRIIIPAYVKPALNAALAKRVVGSAPIVKVTDEVYFVSAGEYQSEFVVVTQLQNGQSAVHAADAKFLSLVSDRLFFGSASTEMIGLNDDNE